MPFLRTRLVRMHPKVLGALAVDVTQTATRLINLKVLFPAANAESIVSQRSSILLDGEWERVPMALASLRKHYSEEVIAEMAGTEPLLLLEDVEVVLLELSR
jgi:hypothetical protein